ncbi:MAG: glyoxalase/bleomycin resistance/extradiol dioxygenase family protein [Candidatus Eisenbacteria bacterium]
MHTTPARMLFVNLAVEDLERSKEFFAKLGFEFNAQFTDDNAAAMIINESCGVMLLREPFFQGFTKKEIADTTAGTECLLAFTVESREAVDRMVQTAMDAGAGHAMDKQDHGFMYSGSFYDLDAHHWEVFWMDPATVQP